MLIYINKSYYFLMVYIYIYQQFEVHFVIRVQKKKPFIWKVSSLNLFFILFIFTGCFLVLSH